MSKKKGKGLIRVGLVTLNILSELEDDIDPRHRKKNKYIEIDGYTVKSTSQRYVVFQKNLVCVSCGVEGKYFAMEKNLQDKTYHLNLYALNKNGKEVLMTKDHILAKSNGGRNVHSNYQTMCITCNMLKGKNII